MREEVILTSIQETLLLPLWGRAIEVDEINSKLNDEKAKAIVNSLNYDFSRLDNRVSEISRLSWISRSIFIDAKVKEFIGKHPEASIVNIGCGLDTTYERVDNKKAEWYELDFPEVIDFRKKYISEEVNRRFISSSVFDDKWYQEIENKDNVLIILAGVIYYFTDEEILRLLQRFGNEFRNCIVVFDYCSHRGREMANKKLLRESGMDKNVLLESGIEELTDYLKSIDYIEVNEDKRMFEDYRKEYPKSKRFGMWISDKLKFMSLAEITISKNR